MYDTTEAANRGIKKPKYNSKHPFAAIEHRVIDSPAYADLTFAARSLLQILTRQLTKDNNGHLQATYKYLQRFGFGSEHTISRTIKELVAHGIIYRTRCGGYQNGASLYAVTWLSITKKQGLFLGSFKPCAWRDWSPENKLPPRKMQESRCRNGIQATSTGAESAVDSPLRIADYELIPCRGAMNEVPMEILP